MAVLSATTEEKENRFDYTQEFNSYPAAELAIANFCSGTGHSFSKNLSTGKFNKCSIPQLDDKPTVSSSSRQPELAPKDGRPFITIGIQHLTCRYSKKRNNSKNEGAKTSNDHQYDRKNTRERMFVSADHNCKAKIHIREALCFQFEKGVKNLKRKKQEFCRAVLNSIEKGDLSAHPFERRFIVAFPKEDEHTDHPKGEECGSTRRVDKMVINFVHDTVKATGETRPREMQKKVDEFVRDILTEQPEQGNRQFNPTRKDLYSHIHRAVSNERKSGEEQEEIESYLKDLGSTQAIHSWFRPRCQEKGNKFLLVLQTIWQQNMLSKYGETVIMDATFGTTKYNLPLYQIAVRTNSVYVPVGFIITEDLTADCLAEGLQIYASLNKEWNPKVFMIDDDQREKSAIKQIFPESKYYICRFHAIKAWERWLQRKETKSHVKEIKSQLANIQYCLTIAEYEEHVANLRKRWGDHKDFMMYMDTFWLTSPETWAIAFRPFNEDIGMATTNGVERLNSLLKKEIQNANDSSVVGLIRTLLNLERQRRDSYTAKNDRMRNLSVNIPEFLHERSPKVFDHCTPGRLNDASLLSVEERSDDGVYIVNKQQVNFSSEMDICSCFDFRKYFFPCKHILAVLLKKGLAWNALPKKYRERSILNIDRHCGVAKKEILIGTTVQDSAKPINSPKVLKENILGNPIYPTMDSDHITQRKQEGVKLLLELRDLLIRCHSLEMVNTTNRILDKAKKNLQLKNCFGKAKRHQKQSGKAHGDLENKLRRKTLTKRKRYLLKKALLSSWRCPPIAGKKYKTRQFFGHSTKRLTEQGKQHPGHLHTQQTPPKMSDNHYVCRQQQEKDQLKVQNEREHVKQNFGKNKEQEHDQERRDKNVENEQETLTKNENRGQQEPQEYCQGQQASVQKQHESEQDQQTSEQEQNTFQQEQQACEQETQASEQEQKASEQEQQTYEQEQQTCEQEQQTSGQEQQVSEQDQWTSEQEKQTSEQQQRTSEKEQQTSEQEQQVYEQEQQVSEQDQWTSEQDKQTSEQEHEQKQQDQDILQKNMEDLNNEPKYQHRKGKYQQKQTTSELLRDNGKEIKQFHLEKQPSKNENLEVHDQSEEDQGQRHAFEHQLDLEHLDQCQEQPLHLRTCQKRMTVNHERDQELHGQTQTQKQEHQQSENESRELHQQQSDQECQPQNEQHEPDIRDNEDQDLDLLNQSQPFPMDFGLPILLDYESVWKLHPESSAVMGYLDGTKLHGSSIGSLKPGHSVSDEVISAYCKHKSRERNDVFMMDCLVASSLVTHPSQAPMFRHTLDLMDKTVIIAPVILNKHWQLFVLYPKQYTMIYVNPVGEHNGAARIKAFTHGWKKVLEKRCAAGIGEKAAMMKRWDVRIAPHQIQNDGTSCGIFVMKFVDFILERKCLETPFDVNNARKEIAQYLMQSTKVEEIAELCRGCSLMYNKRNEQGIDLDIPQSWLQCESCRWWYHYECCGSEKSFQDLRNSVFLCSVCDMAGIEGQPNQYHQSQPISNGGANQSILTSGRNSEGNDQHLPTPSTTISSDITNQSTCRNTYQIIRLKRNIKICQGCRRKFNHPAVAPNDLVVRHYESVTFFDRIRKERVTRWSNSHYHCRAMCIQSRNPDFQLRHLVTDPEIQLTEHHIRQLESQGLNITEVIHRSIPF